MPGVLKGQYFEKMNGGEQQFTKFIFWLPFLLSTYIENNHNGEKRRKTEDFSVNIGPHEKKNWILVGLSQETISRYCPIKPGLLRREHPSPSMIPFEPPQLLNFDFDADPA
jgi:hypothetical protein